MRHLRASQQARGKIAAVTELFRGQRGQTFGAQIPNGPPIGDFRRSDVLPEFAS